jgi:hypothetical protein
MAFTVEKEVAIHTGLQEPKVKYDAGRLDLWICDRWGRGNETFALDPYLGWCVVDQPHEIGALLIYPSKLVT